MNGGGLGGMQCRALTAKEKPQVPLPNCIRSKKFLNEQSESTGEFKAQCQSVLS
jgi:hypothetical protein